MRSTKSQLNWSTYLAGEAVDSTANGTPKHVHIVLDDSPSGAVSCLTVERVFDPLLGEPHRPGQMFLVQLVWNKLQSKLNPSILLKQHFKYRFDLSFQQRRVAVVTVIAVRARYGRLVAEFNHMGQTISANVVNQHYVKCYPNTTICI